MARALFFVSFIWLFHAKGEYHFRIFVGSSMVGSLSRLESIVRATRQSAAVQESRVSREADSMMGLGSWRMARRKAATSSGLNWVLAQRSSSLRACSAVRPFL